MSSWKGVAKHEVDEVLGQVAVGGAVQDADKLDLTEAHVRAGERAGRRLRLSGVVAKTTSAGGLEAYETTIGWGPCPEEPLKLV